VIAANAEYFVSNEEIAAGLDAARAIHNIADRHYAVRSLATKQYLDSLCQLVRSRVDVPENSDSDRQTEIRRGK
jgi:hypothetical protein